MLAASLPQETDMTSEPGANVQQAVPFFRISDMQSSLRFYVEGLGFILTRNWINQGKLRWCWLQLDGAALMLQEFRREGPNAWLPTSKVGEGVSICFQCNDALSLFRQFTARGVQASLPFVGNAMWVTSVSDPDGYKLDFESPTDTPEETIYQQP